MTKADLVEDVSRVAEISRREGAAVVEALLASIVREMREGSRVEVRRFGTFGIRRRRSRLGRNPRTGEQVVVGPKKVVFFKPGKALQEIIQNAPESRSITEKIP